MIRQFQKWPVTAVCLLVLELFATTEATVWLALTITACKHLIKLSDSISMSQPLFTQWVEAMYCTST